MSDKDLLVRLVRRGDKVEIVKGQLCITSASGIEVPEDWLKEKEETLIAQISELTGIPALKYLSRSVTPLKSEGILTLQLQQLPQRHSRCIHFNVNNKRTRSTAKHKKGEPLPKNQFTVRDNHALAKFWHTLPDKYPGGAKLHDRLGKLKQFWLTGVTVSPQEEKLNQKSFALLEITDDEVRQALGFTLTKHRNNATDTDKTHLTHGQVTDNSRITGTDKETPKPQQPRGLEGYSATGQNSHGKTVNSNTGTQPPPYIPYNPLFESSSGKRPEDQTVDEWLSDYDAGPNYDSGNFPNDFG